MKWAKSILRVFFLFVAINVQAFDHVIYVYPSSFSPATVNIAVGDTVTWVNVDDDIFPHVIQSSTGAWSPGYLYEYGDTFTLMFNGTGAYPFHDALSGATGQVNVGTTGGGGENAQPTVSITSPDNNAVLNAPASFTVSANASDPDGSVASVEFFLGATSLGSVAAPPYSVSASSIPSGIYSLSAIVTDNQGATATDSILLVVNELPSVSLINPTNGSTFAAPHSGLIEAFAEDSDDSIVAVRFFLNGSLLTVDNTAPYSAPLSNLSAGVYTIGVEAEDGWGAKTLSTATIQVWARTSLSNLLKTTGQLGFDITGTVPGATYVVHASSDLITWSPISTNIAGSSVLPMIDGGASGARRFYRVESR